MNEEKSTYFDSDFLSLFKIGLFAINKPKYQVQHEITRYRSNHFSTMLKDNQDFTVDHVDCYYYGDDSISFELHYDYSDQYCLGFTVEVPEKYVPAIFNHLKDLDFQRGYFMENGKRTHTVWRIKKDLTIDVLEIYDKDDKTMDYMAVSPDAPRSVNIKQKSFIDILYGGLFQNDI